jgi:uncharacterized membrane protein YhaH (DUF805 family)
MRSHDADRGWYLLVLALTIIAGAVVSVTTTVAVVVVI